MNRDELAALRDAIDVLLTWPDAVHDQIAAWLTPEAVLRPGNGLDPHPPPRQAKRQSAFAAKTAERKLIAAMRATPGASVIMLARSVGGNRSSVGEQLRKLAGRGVVTKDSAGHWRLVAELAANQLRPEPGQGLGGEAAGPTQPPSP